MSTSSFEPNRKHLRIRVPSPHSHLCRNLDIPYQDNYSPPFRPQDKPRTHQAHAEESGFKEIDSSSSLTLPDPLQLDILTPLDHAALNRIAPCLRVRMAEIKKEQAEKFLAKRSVSENDRDNAMNIIKDCETIKAGKGTTRAQLEGY